jgi:branched-subunit amino acid ABC-type transport system permease component
MPGNVADAISAAIPLAAIYVIGGLAWAIIFRASKIFNFGTAQFIVLGAYLAYFFNQDVHLPVWLALVFALAAMALIGALTQTVFMRRLLDASGDGSAQASFAPVILTFGLAAIIEHMLSIGFGTGPEYTANPFPNTVFHLASGIVLTGASVIMAAVGVVLWGGCILVIRFSKWGMQMRAAAEQPLLASQSGINVGGILVGAWASAAVMAAVIGIIYSYSSVVSPDIGDIGLRSLAPVIVGGMDSVTGVLPGAIIVALVESFAVLAFGESVRDAAVQLVILAVLIVRPSGLLGGVTVRRP